MLTTEQSLKLSRLSRTLTNVQDVFDPIYKGTALPHNVIRLFLFIAERAQRKIPTRVQDIVTHLGYTRAAISCITGKIGEWQKLGVPGAGFIQAHRTYNDAGKQIYEYDLTAKGWRLLEIMLKDM